MLPDKQWLSKRINVSDGPRGDSSSLISLFADAFLYLHVGNVSESYWSSGASVWNKIKNWELRVDPTEFSITLNKSE